MSTIEHINRIVPSIQYHGLVPQSSYFHSHDYHGCIRTWPIKLTEHKIVVDYANVVFHTCGANFSNAAATEFCTSSVGVSAIMSPPRPVPLILAPTAPAARAASTKSSSSLQLTVSSCNSAWF
mmetsp:Transcript_28070/g.59258  ORF Transcript_28070/g.59258 Transcript_28070/m.59258 type:complete len:123 (-) Transcript_28070:795-1163(-)